MTSWRKRLSIGTDARLALGYERHHLPGFDLCIAVAPRDAGHIMEKCPGVRAIHLPNGVDTDYFHIDRDSNMGATIVFSGRMGYPENVEAAVFLARDILPLVQREVPEARLVLVGPETAPDVLALRECPGVTVLGFVEDLREVYRGADVNVSPMLSGAGIKNKVLEAMAMETPVVMTPIAAEGFETLPPDVAVVAQGAAEIARETVGLLKDPVRARAMGRRGRGFVVENYGESEICEKLDRILLETVEKAKRSS